MIGFQEKRYRSVAHPMKRETIVVIEDEGDIRDVIEHNLLREGYQVHPSSNGEEGLRLAQQVLPDLILLDLMLPGLNGLDVCRRLKQQPETRNISIVMVSARGEESDIVLGLEIGADDYVTKPFSPKELLARIKAVLRRSPLSREQIQGRLVRGQVIVDMGRHQVKVDGTAVGFTATELRLLYFLASNPGRVFTRDHLLSQVIGKDAFVVDRNIDVHVRSVRQKLGNYRDLIETIRGVGYRFRDEEQ